MGESTPWVPIFVAILIIGALFYIPIRTAMKEGFGNSSLDDVHATGPPGTSGPSSTGASPVGPNIPDPASNYPTGVNAGSNTTTNAPAGVRPVPRPLPLPRKGVQEGPSSVSLLPADPYREWAQAHPNGEGLVAGKNYLNAGALININTVGQSSVRNASIDLRSEPANPQVTLSPWFNSAMNPDASRSAV